MRALAVAGAVVLGLSVALGAAGARAHAQPRTTAPPRSSETPRLPSEAPLPSCLDQSIKDELGRELRPRGVQKRDFLKNKKVELIARGGLYAGDLTSSSWIGGGALAFYFTEDFGLQVSVDVTPVALDLDEPLAEFFGDDRFEPALGYLALAGLTWSPIHAKLKIGDGIVHADMLLNAGAGRLFHDSVQGITFDAGVALELFTTGWFTVRFEAHDVMAVQEAVAETRYTHNLVALMGLALWIPTGL
jgi:outer membrane beta-barrel protein